MRSKILFELNSFDKSKKYIFKWYEPGAADDRCFTRKNIQYEPYNKKICLPREKYKYLMACGININLQNINQSHILVIGSTGVIGNAITSELFQNGIPFIEIRSHFQFNINRKHIFKMLKEIRITSIILLANDKIWVQPDFTFDFLFKFCDKRKIPIFQIVENFLNANYSIKTKLIQVKTKPVWGPVYLTPYQRYPGHYFYKCLINNQSSLIKRPNIHSKQEYTFSLDVAKYIIENIVQKYLNKELNSKITEITIPDFPTISNDELKFLLIEKKCQFHSKLTNHSLITDLNRQKFELVWNSLQTERNIGPRQKQKAYATIVSSVSNLNRVIQLFSISLKCTDIIIQSYPNLALEFIVLYCPNDDINKDFYEIFNVSDQLKKFMRIIEIPHFYVLQLKKLYNIKYFPEFIIKNIGVRRACGDYIFTINSDVILPQGFFESIQKKLFTSLSYIRSHRVTLDFLDVNSILEYYYTKNDYVFQYQTFSDVCYNKRYYDHFDRNGCGDFQGAHRKMWFSIHGFIESNYVFHIDTALSLDFASIPTSLFARIIGHNIHIEHVKISNLTDHFQFYNISFKNAIRQGLSSSMLNEYKRPNWGAKGKDFAEY